mmetsp:Transcript_23023/g.38541  ORF Transcript_23023/g.38541 Transcript_23023/m.38541 type:complete len:105 (-) Transcript_23023:1566-1880(-)
MMQMACVASGVRVGLEGGNCCCIHHQTVSYIHRYKTSAGVCTGLIDTNEEVGNAFPKHAHTETPYGDLAVAVDEAPMAKDVSGGHLCDAGVFLALSVAILLKSL